MHRSLSVTAIFIIFVSFISVFSAVVDVAQAQTGSTGPTTLRTASGGATLETWVGRNTPRSSRSTQATSPTSK